MPTSIGAYQSSLVLNETIEIQGAYPSRDGNGGTTLGMLHTYAFGFGMSAAPMALGQLMPLSQNTALFSILGTTYGGNGVTNFALPNLAGRTAISPGQGPGLSDVSLGGQTGSATTVLTQAQLPASVGGASAALNENQPELGLQYLIRVEGIFPGQDSGGGALNMIGAVVKFAGGFIPGSYMACDGQLLQISQYEELFTLIGTTFGGDGQTTFALPDLRGRTIVGASGNHQLGQVFGSENLTIGQSNLPVAMGGNAVPLDNHEPSLALNYLIALQGVFPSSNGAASETDPMFGEVVAFAGNFAPRGFAFAQGQLLPINQNQALFSLLGTTYGGNGQTTFALPDLRDKDVVGQGSGFALGDKIGSDSITLTLDNIPNLTYSGTDAGATHYGGNGDDVINALGGVDTIITNGGNDTITGGAGSDTINGGPGVDVAVFSGHHGNYAINYNSTTQAFTVADQRGGSPDGSDTVSQVELFQFSDGLFVPNQAGGSTQTLADLAGVAPWLSQVSSFDAVGSLTSQTINNDNNTHVTNDYDTAGAVAWTWRTSSYDSSGRLVSQTGLNDDGTHWLTLYDAVNAYSWANITIGFNANWIRTGLTATRDDGSHTVTNPEVALAYDTLPWFQTPYDANVNSTPVNTTLFGGGGKDVLYGHNGQDTIDGGANADLLAGGLANDTFAFHRGEANGDSVLDFDANGEADHLKFIDYGTGATFTQNDATHWQVNYNAGASHDVITIANGAAIHAGDYFFT